MQTIADLLHPFSHSDLHPSEGLSSETEIVTEREQEQCMGRVSIDTQQCEIKKIFSDEFVFTIPRYQRPYAWTTDEAGVLLEDLLDAMGDSNQDVEETPPYFLGSIVLTKGEKPDAEVIDGQQRLTTITILLAALRALIHAESARDLDLFSMKKQTPSLALPAVIV
jgi:uncharacterized protein with ParB-like and HNH nuclease domain